jgi:hypothetical protein
MSNPEAIDTKPGLDPAMVERFKKMPKHKDGVLEMKNNPHYLFLQDIQ